MRNIFLITHSLTTIPMAVLPIAARLSEAVDFIVTFATSVDNREAVGLLKDVDWIDATRSRDIIATIDTMESIEPTPDEQELYVKVFHKLDGHPDCMSEVEGSPGHVKATSVMHCESALLHYIADNELSAQVDPYIGTSQPACYACVMLVRAFNWVFRKNFALGRRCNTADATWMMPEMGPKVYEKLVSSLRQDFKLLANKVYYDRTRAVGIGGSQPSRELPQADECCAVNDTSILSEDVRRAMGLLPPLDRGVEGQ